MVILLHSTVASIKPKLMEIYIKGPGMLFAGNPEKYITEIIIPIN